MSEVRTAFIHEVRTLYTPVRLACEKFQISRKTGYKWLKHRAQRPVLPFRDRSRRPEPLPNRTGTDLAQPALDIRELFKGPLKVHVSLRSQERTFPSVRTVANILKRNGCIHREEKSQTRVHSVERAQPHELWQCDYK